MGFRFVIMGAGSIAEKFCDAVKLLDDCEIAAVASKSMKKAQAFAEKHGIRQAYDSYETMLLEQRPDCVYIATTPNFHYELAKLCLKHKTPVLCEKAMFMNSRDAGEIFEASEKQGVFVMEALWSRFLPANITARQWMEEGRIGKVNCLSCTIGCAFDKIKNSRNLDPALGGGAAFDLTVYNYELATWFFGDEIRDMDVTALWEERGIDSFNQICLRYEGKLAVLLSSCVSMLEEKLIISGTEGKIVVPHAHYAEEAFLYDKAGKEIAHFADHDTKNGFVYEICEVMKCIQKGAIESRHVPHRDTLRCAELFDRIYENRRM